MNDFRFWFQLASCELESGRKIIIVKQDLTDLEVDVIVNAADSELKLAGGLALVIAQKGQQRKQRF